VVRKRKAVAEASTREPATTGENTGTCAREPAMADDDIDF
jgi:hypothetical protein